MRRRVLHISVKDPMRGAYSASRLTDKYSSKFVARSIVLQEEKTFSKTMASLYDVDLTPRKDYNEVKEKLQWADIYHIHGPVQPVVELLNKLSLEYKPHTPVVVEKGYGHPEDTFNNSSRHVKVCSANIIQDPQADFVLPLAIDIKNHTPLDRFNNKNTRLVTYIPTSAPGKRDKDTCYRFIYDSLKALSRNKAIYYSSEIPDADASIHARMRVSRLGVNNVVRGSYYPGFLLYMAYGVLPIANIDTRILDQLMKITKCSSVPYIQATRDDFMVKAATAIKSGKVLEMSPIVRKWVDTYYTPNQIIEHYDELYSAIY